MMKAMYTVSAVSQEGRYSHVRTSDGLIDFDTRAPREMDGPGGGANLEQFFAAGYATCYSSAIRMVAGSRKIRTGDFTVTCTVHLGTDERGYYRFAAEMEIDMPVIEQEQAEELARQAHEVCPFARSIQGNVETKIYVRAAHPVYIPD